MSTGRLSAKLVPIHSIRWSSRVRMQSADTSGNITHLTVSLRIVQAPLINANCTELRGKTTSLEVAPTTLTTYVFPSVIVKFDP